jgi:hypothetical protein
MAKAKIGGLIFIRGVLRITLAWRDSITGVASLFTCYVISWFTADAVWVLFA